jgi:hypothetical protein
MVGCDNGVTAQDKEFINKIKNHLKKEGDIVKVSDIYPGDWEYVCANEKNRRAEDLIGHIFLDPSRQDNKDPILNLGIGDSEYAKNVEVLNTKSTIANNLNWGIIFFYPPNKIQYFHIPNAIYYHAGGNCTDKKNAFFELKTSQSPQKKPGINFLNSQISSVPPK